MKTQGSQLYTIDPLDGSILRIVCVTSIDGIDTSIEQNETTCLESMARTYEAGLATPGTATFGIRPDPQQDSHKRLHALKKAGTLLPWALGWSDGVDIAPTAAAVTGVDSIALTNGGSGYTAPPAVSLTGGGGTGATAVAALGTGANAGKVASITVTNPGTGYTTAPAVAFTGGTGTGAAATSAVDGKADFVLPTTRSWLMFEGYMTSFPFSFAQNASVESSIGVQVSGDVDWISKVGA